VIQNPFEVRQAGLERSRGQIVEEPSISKVDRFVLLQYFYDFFVPEIIHHDREDSSRFCGQRDLKLPNIPWGQLEAGLQPSGCLSSYVMSLDSLL